MTATIPLRVRISRDALPKLMALRDRMNVDRPGPKMTVSSVVAMLVERGLSSALDAKES